RESWGMFEKTALSLRSQPFETLPLRSLPNPRDSEGVTAATQPTTVLRIGSRIVSRCRDGFLETEYALFERNETLLCSRSASSHEIGYLTTARNARDRLARLGVSIELAVAAANALSAEVRRSYARGECVCALAAELGE